jgi:hypothetical protein
MIPIPAGWRHHHGAHRVSFYPPGGGGRFRYLERLPLLPASRILGLILDEDMGSIRTTWIGRAERFLTAEGEVGLTIRLRGLRGAAPVWRVVAIVFTEEFAAALDTLIDAADRRDELDRRAGEIMVSMSYGLGRRQRRFYYRPPSGWWAIPCGLVATWHPPGYPRELTTLTIHPAVPHPQPRWGQDLRGDLLDGLVDPGAVASDSVVDCPLFAGCEYRVADQRVTRELIALYRAPYLYRLRLDTAETDRFDDLCDLLREVARSVQPVALPGDRRFAHGAAPQLTHWVD